MKTQIGDDIRDLTDEEIAQYEKDTITINAEKVARTAAREALLERLGITDEEARMLLS